MPRTFRLSFYIAALAVLSVAFLSAARHWKTERDVASAAAPATSIGRDEAAQLITAGTDGVVMPGTRTDLLMQVHNGETTTIHLRAVSQAGNAHVDHRDGCTALATYLTVLPTQGLVMEVPPGETRSFRVAGAVYLSRQAGVDCAGASFSVPVVVTYQH